MSTAITSNFTDSAFTQRLKRLMAETLPYGLAVEALSAAGRNA